MSSTTATATSAARAHPARSRRRTVAAGVLTAIAVLSGVIAVSVNAPMEDQFEHDARVLITSFGLGMALLSVVVALVPFRRGEQWAWLALWVWPAFFVSHVALLGTVLPDGLFAVVTAGALLLAGPSRS